MKTFRWWLLVGVALASLGAVVLGPMVYGQVPQGIPKGNPAPIIIPPPSAPVPSIPNPVTVSPPTVSPPTVSSPIPMSSSPTMPPPSPPMPMATNPVVPPPSLKPSLPEPAKVTPPSVIEPLPLKAEPASPSAGKTDGITPVDTRLGRQEPAVSIEWVGPPVTRINHPMACQLLVRNTSQTAVHNVVVRHRPSQGVVCKSSEPQPVTDQGELVWTLGTLSAGQVRRIDLQMIVQVKGALTCQATVTFSGAAAHHVQVSEPQLQIKMKSPAKVLANEPVTLLFAVGNPGDGSADNIRLKLLLPEGLDHQHGWAIEANIGALAAKEVRTLQIVCSSKGLGPQECVVTATGDGGLSSTDKATVEITLPKLELAMAGPKLRYIDRKATYVMKVTNPGSATAANVVVHGVVPTAFKYQGISAGGLYDQQTRAASWVIGDLEPGQTREVSLDLMPTAPGQHKVAAQVTSARGLKTDADVQTMVEGLSALLLEVADTDDPVEVGAETTYEIRVANTGTKTETNIEVICTLPEQVEFRSAKSPGNLRSCVEGREVSFEPLAKLAPRADVVYRVTVRGKSAGDVRFRVRVRADGLSEPMLREEATRFYNDNLPAK